MTRDRPYRLHRNVRYHVFQSEQGSSTHICPPVHPPRAGILTLALEHGPKVFFQGDALPRTATLFGCRLTVSEREANKEALAHLITTLRHGFQGLLLLVYLLVLGHVSLVTKIVKVSGICLRVQLGDKGRASLTEGLPVNFSEVLMGIDILNVREASSP